MKKLIRYVRHRPIWQRLDMIPRQLASEYQPEDIDHPTALLMQMTQVRSPRNVRLLMKKHHAATPEELIRLLPSRQRRHRPWKRIMSLIRRTLGVLPYDPAIKLAREIRPRQGRRRS